MMPKYFHLTSRGSQITFSKLEPGHHVKAIFDYEDQTFVDLIIHNGMLFTKVILYCPLFRDLKCVVFDVSTVMPPNIYRNVKMEELFLLHQQFTIDQWRTLFHSTFLLDYIWTLNSMPKVLTIQHSNFVTIYFQCDLRCQTRQICHYTAFKLDVKMAIHVPQYFCHHKQHAVRCGSNVLSFRCLCAGVHVPAVVTGHEVTAGPWSTVDTTKLFLASNLQSKDPWYAHHLLFLGTSPTLESQILQVWADEAKLNAPSRTTLNDTNVTTSNSNAIPKQQSIPLPVVPTVTTPLVTVADVFKKPTKIPRRIVVAKTDRSFMFPSAEVTGHSARTTSLGPELPTQVLPSIGSMWGGTTYETHRAHSSDRVMTGPASSNLVSPIGPYTPTALPPKGQPISTIANLFSSTGVALFPFVTFDAPSDRPVPSAVQNPVKLENRDYSPVVTLPSDKLATTPGLVPNSQSLLDFNQSIQANPVGTSSQETPLDLTVSKTIIPEETVPLKRNFPTLMSSQQDTSLSESDTDDYKRVKHCCMIKVHRGKTASYKIVPFNSENFKRPENNTYHELNKAQKLVSSPLVGLNSKIKNPVFATPIKYQDDAKRSARTVEPNIFSFKSKLKSLNRGKSSLRRSFSCKPFSCKSFYKNDSNQNEAKCNAVCNGSTTSSLASTVRHHTITMLPVCKFNKGSSGKTRLDADRGHKYRRKSARMIRIQREKSSCKYHEDDSQKLFHREKLHYQRTSNLQSLSFRFGVL